MTRYSFAAESSEGGALLELACGTGIGLGMLQQAASFVVGGDVSPVLLNTAQKQFRSRVPLVQLSAQQLPFRAESFQTVVFMEASYYVPDLAQALNEIRRVLSPGGRLVIVNANPDRPDFIPSPYSIAYHSSDEFRRLLAERGFSVVTAAAFPLAPPTRGPLPAAKSWLFMLARRMLERLHLVPRTLEGRARLKRILLGRLMNLPSELTPDFATVAPVEPTEAGVLPGFKVIYVRATKP